METHSEKEQSQMKKSAYLSETLTLFIPQVLTLKEENSLFVSAFWKTITTVPSIFWSATSMDEVLLGLDNWKHLVKVSSKGSEHWQNVVKGNATSPKYEKL